MEKEIKRPISVPLKRFSDCTADELLDKTLETLKVEFKGGRPEFKGELNINQISNDLSTNFKIRLFPEDIKMILDKLEIDKYVEHNRDKYCITFEGVFFIQKGGYKQKEKKDIAGYQWTVTKERVLHIGAILAGIWVVLQIIHYIYQFVAWWFFLE